jgi:hypothetical protein
MKSPQYLGLLLSLLSPFTHAEQVVCVQEELEFWQRPVCPSYLSINDSNLVTPSDCRSQTKSCFVIPKPTITTVSKVTQAQVFNPHTTDAAGRNLSSQGVLFSSEWTQGQIALTSTSLTNTTRSQTLALLGADSLTLATPGFKTLRIPRPSADSTHVILVRDSSTWEWANQAAAMDMARIRMHTLNVADSLWLQGKYTLNG